MIIEGVSIPDFPDAEPPLPARQWPMTVPAVAQIFREGLTFDRPVTFLVGENGSGKSTVLEGIAEAYGLDGRTGHAGRRYAQDDEPGVLGARMRLIRTRQGSRMLGRRAKGFFLRAETAYEQFVKMGYATPDVVSHGESVLQVLDGRFTDVGLYLLDEPEDGLSFSSCLRLLAQFSLLVEEGAQVICATHSPLVAAYPGAAVLEVGKHGIRPRAWRDLELVDHWSRFMARPDAYLRGLL
ncbi:ABC transporter, ATP-binding protein [Longispora fulva]|uniref:Putative ATPase n=1 Tax=Longispora fulva TaxID=619741 RepID=A0A8J7GSN0_9ACTN|nr:AAA family ATPase [Longispora fulva]MBG6137548.1 putative ATPase [Longispora fulva]GIG61098.1 ABC transporter, ATP-binding protein [Longispora fulva]